MYFVGVGLTDNTRKKAILMYGGKQLMEKFGTMQEPTWGEVHVEVTRTARTTRPAKC